jgi:hypothetical protein
MRSVFYLSGVLCILFGTTVEARGQAGRYIPVPRLPPGGGGLSHGLPHTPLFHGSVSNDVFWVIVAVLGGITLAIVGWQVGLTLGRGKSRAHSNAWEPSPTSGPPVEDLILQSSEVEEKAHRTTRLLETLTKRDPAFDPWPLRAFISASFSHVQQCWMARDYGPVNNLLGTSILAQHEELLRAMRRNCEINCIEDLRIRRLEFVHVACPAETDRQEVTALITFEARVYFVNDRNGAFLGGSQKILPYQEFWIFRRHGQAWRLATIDRSHDSDRLMAANYVEGMKDLDRSNAEEGVIAL